MKRLPNCLLLSLAMLALPAAGSAAAVTAVCSAVQAAGLSLPERHAAAKLEAEAALDGAGQGSCRGSAVQVMTSPGGGGEPLQLHDANAPQATDDGATPQPTQSAVTGVLRELPAEVFLHWAHAAPMAAPAAFTGILPLLPVVRLLPARC
ncbi:hypothetical protein BJN34_29900 [Cupriavidus necator]|uniref:Uncharacterized protein n=1 Tax=Cupriavidus necator TaxID=106590 RepID=A0A1U9UZE3_CUPNE|nr:hypothetical protein [Cupriavidus necator]AQV98084.1 hypothetical protein BJN34_29900 [Cupriavidus necator]